MEKILFYSLWGTIGATGEHHLWAFLGLGEMLRFELKFAGKICDKSRYVHKLDIPLCRENIVLIDKNGEPIKK